MRICIVMILLSFIFGCTSEQQLRHAAILQRPDKQLRTYNSSFDPNIIKRIQPAPKEILQYLNQRDSTDIYQAFTPGSKDLKLFAEYFALLPDTFQKNIEEHVVGIYFISNFGGGGMVDFLYDENGRMYTVLYLNPKLFSASLAEWIEMRENASFQDDDSITIKVKIESNYRALIHTLFHEASHLYDYYNNVTPYTEPFFKKNEGANSRDFTRQVWFDYNIPEEKYDFLRASKLSGWGLNGKIQKSQAVDLYQKLGASPFSSLYGLLSWAEDFAETFTWFYLHSKLGISYQVTVSRNSKVVVEVTPVKNKRVTDRYQLFSQIVE